MKMNVANLPGVGKKLSFINHELKVVVLIIHYTGKRELYFFEDEDDDEAAFSFELTSEETKLMATQMLGATLDEEDSKKVERINMIRKQAVVEWLDVEKYKKLDGMKMNKLMSVIPDGVTLVGIFHQNDFIIDPTDDLILEPEDTLMVVGKKQPIADFLEKCEGKDRD